MTYNTECKDDPVIDINQPRIDEPGGWTLSKGSAGAVKITPTSRCLDSIKFFGMKRLADIGLNIEIREHDSTNNIPKGVPGSSDGRIGTIISVPYNNIPTEYGDLTISRGLILPTDNTTYWIVIYSSDFSCNVNDLTLGRFQLTFYGSGNLSVYYNHVEPLTPGCRWDIPTGVLSLALATYKKTYVPPSGEGTSKSTIIGLIAVAGIAGAILYFSTRKKE